MSYVEFASGATSLNEVSEPLRSPLIWEVGDGESVRLVICEPEFKTMGRVRPATVTVITDRRWLIAIKEGRNDVAVISCGFDKMLLVEMAIILLAGHLKLDYVADNSQSSTVFVEFNTVMKGLYHKATEMILSGISGEPATDAKSDGVLFVDWPLKFRNMILDSLPKGSMVLVATQWPEVIGGFRRELSPAAALVATNREILLVSDERAPLWAPASNASKLGGIITYFPLIRLGKVHISVHERVAYLDLEMHARHGGETLHVPFPPEYEPAVRKVIDQIQPQINSGA